MIACKFLDHHRILMGTDGWRCAGHICDRLLGLGSLFMEHSKFMSSTGLEHICCGCGHLPLSVMLEGESATPSCGGGEVGHHQLW